jgi:hypothetical protein
MFSMITHIYNEKIKGPTLMELYTATRKLKSFFFTTRNVQCVHHGWQGTHRCNIQVLATHASTWMCRYSSMLQWSIPLGQWGHVSMVGQILCMKRMLHSNHRLTRVIFQHPISLSIHTLPPPSSRNVNYDQKQLPGEKILELFLLSVYVLKICVIRFSDHKFL